MLTKKLPYALNWNNIDFMHTCMVILHYRLGIAI